VAGALPEFRAPAPDADPRRRFRAMIDAALPVDGDGYVALIGGLMAEHRRHPELIEAFRETILLPRRALARAAIEEAQRKGELRPDVDAEHAVDILGGPFLARVFAGADVGPAWRDRVFEAWWSTMAPQPRTAR
jgi:hypothetical protein